MVYVPNTGQITFLDNIVENLQDFTGVLLLVGGSQQDTPRRDTTIGHILPYTDSKNSSKYTKILNVWRIHLPKEKGYTCSIHTLMTLTPALICSLYYYNKQTCLGRRIQILVP